MSSPQERWIALSIRIDADNPALLDGLEGWLELGLISHEQVKQLCQQYLSQPLPPRQPVPVFAEEKDEEPVRRRQIFRNRPQQPKSTHVATRLLQSLKAELSVRWLLFLGLFMVVVSSGVLAASQWERFPVAGQYGILLAYTLAFWGGSRWTGRQNQLPLTAETLRQVTLLLVPLNFWAMDGFGLWRNPLELLTVAIATLLLTAITVNLYQKSESVGHLPLLNYLLLSYLNWGWSWRQVPIAAIYIGVILTAIICLYRVRRQPNVALRTDIILLIYGLILLLGRGIFVADVDVTALGLAVGICGWLLYLFSPVWMRQSGYIFLFFGWLISIQFHPWQAFIVSGLAVSIFTRHLLRFWRRRDLAAIFAIGLQMVWLLGPMIPDGVRETAIITGTEITNSQNNPWSLLSLTWFPYLIFMLGVTDWLYRKNKIQLAQFGELLALGFGLFLTSLGVFNPAMRSLNLIVSTLTLAAVTKRRSPNVFRVYLTHAIGLLALLSAVDWLIPNLTFIQWAMVLLVLMVGEFAFSTVGSFPDSSLSSPEDRGDRTWAESGFYLGLVLAGCSYLLLSQMRGVENLMWVATPVALTGVALIGDYQRRKAGELAILAVGMAQFLTLGIDGTRFALVQSLNLAVGCGLMFVNSRLLLTPIPAILTVGFGLTFFASVLWELKLVSDLGWLVVNAIAFSSLWILRRVLQNRESELGRNYTQAADGWAIALCGVQLFLMTVHSLFVYWGVIPSDRVAVGVLILTVVAILFRTWKTVPGTRDFNWGVYAGCWGVELLVAETLGFFSNSLIALAIANTILGLSAQLAGDWWLKRNPDANIPKPWQVIPILYGIFGTILRVDEFAIWTGLNTFGLAFIFIGIGRRQESLKPLVYLGVAGVSAAAFELLFYRVDYQPVGTQLVAIATLATSFVYLYRILLPVLMGYLTLEAGEIKAIAHLHWFVGTVSLGIACFLPGNINALVGLGTGILLTRYAIIQGRNNPHRRQAEFWVYAGLLEAVAISYYVADVLSWGGFFIPWSGAIASLIAYFFYISPWDFWGWPPTPWRRVAVVLPIACVGFSGAIVTPSQLFSWYTATFLSAIFYLVLAEMGENIRFTYISILLVNWMILKGLLPVHADTRFLWIVTPPALSLLYLVQVEPHLKGTNRRQIRHFIRCLSVGLICWVALLESQWMGIVPGAIALATIFLGLAFRTRAFLYIGTATFLINAFNQLILLNSIYSFLKWVIAFIIGLILMWIAANFETRREQLVSLLQNWLAELDNWE